MSQEIIEWYWDCIDSNNPTGLTGFFESQTINVANLFNDEGLNGLHKASKEGYLEIAKILVAKRKVDVDFPAKRNQWTPLHFACSNNRKEMIDFLLDEAANTEIVSKDHKSPYDVSSQDIKEFILNYRADLARKEKIVQLCQEQTFDELKWRLFLQNNPSFSLNRSCNKDGWNALVYAAYYGKPDIIEFLFNHCQVELDHKDKAGRTALHWACASNQFAAIKILIDAGADIDAQDMNGRTVLIQAVADKSTYIVDLLLEYAPSMEVKDRWGYTALTGCQNADIKLKLKEYMRERKEGLTPKAVAQPRTPHTPVTPHTPSHAGGFGHKNSLTSMSFDGEASMMNLQMSAEMEKLKEEIKRQEEELKRQREAMAMKDQIDGSRVVKQFREALPTPVFRMYDAALFGRFENFAEQVARFDATEKSKYIIKSIRDMQAPFQGQFDADTLGEHQVQLAMFVTSLSAPPAPEVHHPAPMMSSRQREPSFIAAAPAPSAAPTMANNTIHLSSPLNSASFSSDRSVVIPAELNRIANGRVTKSKVFVKLANSAEGVSRSQKEKELLSHLAKTALFVQCEGIFFPSSIVTHDGYILSSLPSSSQKITAGLALEPGLENLEMVITNNSAEDNNFFKLADIATQVANIVMSLHNSNLIWSDVKPSNIVLFSIDNKQRWKGIDVESALWQEDASYPPDFLFTPTFLAPEVAHSILHNKSLQPSVKIDSWSVGLLYLWLFKRTGSNPLTELGLNGNKEHVLQVLDNAKDLQIAINKLIETTFGEPHYAGLKHVLSALLDVDPQQRWALDAVKRKGFFQGSATVNRSQIDQEIRDELKTVSAQLHEIQTSIKELGKNLNQQFEGCNRNFALTLRDMGHQLMSKNGEMASQLSDLRSSIDTVLDVSARNPAELAKVMAGFQDNMCNFVAKSVDIASAQNQLHLTKTMEGYDMNMKFYFEEMNKTMGNIDFNTSQNKELLDQSVQNLVILRDQMNAMQASMDKMTEKVDTCHVMLNQMMVVTVQNNIDINNAMSELGDLMKNRTKHLEDALKSQKGQNDQEMSKLFNSTFDRLTTNIAGIFQDIQEDNATQTEAARAENQRALAGMQNMFTTQISEMKSMLSSEAPQFSMILEGMKSIKDDIQKVQVEVEENKQQMQEGFSRMTEFARKQEKMLQSVLLNNYDMPGMFLIVPQAPTTWSKFNPKNWAFNRCKLFFICPVTLTIAGSGKDGGGYAFDVPKDWVKVVAPAVCVGLILLKVGLACSGIPIPIPIPNFKDLGALDFIDNVLSHVGSLDGITSKICDAAVAVGKSTTGQTIAAGAVVTGKGIITGAEAVAAAGAVVANDDTLDDVVTDTAKFLSDNGAAVAKGFSEVKNLLLSKALDNFPQPKFTGLVQVLAKDGSNAWVHSSVASEFYEKGQSIIKKSTGAVKM